MIFLFGIKRNTLVKELLEQCECPNCKKDTHLVLSRYGSYFHIFFIPIFPTGRTLDVQCMYCQQTYDGQYLSPTLASAVQKQKALLETKRPLWHSMGCLMILGFFFLILILVLVSLYKVKTN